MKELFKIIILIIFLILMYILLKQEKRSVRFSFLIYFSLLSIVFMSGLIYISSTYHLNDNPVDGGFNKKYDWVSFLLYFYLIPLFILIGYKLFKFTNESFKKTWAKIAMLIFWIAVLVSIGYVLPFIFILLFYGFAP